MPVRSLNLWRNSAPEAEKVFLESITADPAASIEQLQLLLELKDLKLSRKGIYAVLSRIGLSDKKKRRKFAVLVAQHLLARAKVRGESKAQLRQAMLKLARDGVPSSLVCQLYDVSRKTFFEWQRRARSQDFSLKSLEDKVTGRGRPGILSPKEENEVKKVVLAYPSWGARRLSQFLSEKLEKTVTPRIVQFRLARQGLSEYEARVAWQRQQFATKPWLAAQPLLLRLEGKIPQLSQTFEPLFAFSKLVFWSTSIFLLLFFGSQRAFPNLTPYDILGVTLSELALLIGTFFFAYSLRYYFSLAVVLSFSRPPEAQRTENGNGNGNGNGGLLKIILGIANGGVKEKPPRTEILGMMLDKVKLSRYPFVSIHLPIYNEEKVIERVLTACQNLSWPNFEIVVVDDSTDKTTQIIERFVSKYPNIKHIHRTSRVGFKGGALSEALKHTDPQAEFVLVFDADFIPFPDTIEQFLRYWHVLAGGLSKGKIRSSNIAGIQGYQWHVLNKDENWITRAVRSEYAGSYVIERSGTELLRTVKQIAGSVYMIRRDVLDKFSWGTSITEDFELTLKLYEAGYKVVYTPYIQAPAECVSTLRRLIRQRMRWAEGHSHNIKRAFAKVFSSPNLSFGEKIEFLFLSPYYLQAALFVVGSLAWSISWVVFGAKLPFWTSLWGWSLVFTNFLSLPLMNSVGLFMEESEERDYMGLLSFVLLSYILAPFQAYAAIKGFLERKEGPWFRTPKTGRITVELLRGRFARLIGFFIPTKVERPGSVKAVLEERSPTLDWLKNPSFALATSHNYFNSFTFKPKRIRWVGKLALALLLAISTTIFITIQNVPTIYAVDEVKYLSDDLADGTGGYPNDTDSWQLQTTTPDESNTVCSAVSPGAAPEVKYAKSATGTRQFQPIVCANTSATIVDGKGWYTVKQTGQYPSGTWTFTLRVSDSKSTTGAWGINARVMRFDESAASFTGPPTFGFTTSPDRSGLACDQAADDTDSQVFNATERTITWTCSAPLLDFPEADQALYIDSYANAGTGPGAVVSVILFTERSDLVDADRSKVTTTTFGIPENVWWIVPFALFLPWFIKKKRLAHQSYEPIF